MCQSTASYCTFLSLNRFLVKSKFGEYVVSLTYFPRCSTGNCPFIGIVKKVSPSLRLFFCVKQTNKQDINICTDCLRQGHEPRHAPSSSPGPEDTIAPVGSTGHLDRHGPNGSIALELPHGPRYGPRSLISSFPWMVTRPLDISAGPACVFSSGTGPRPKVNNTCF